MGKLRTITRRTFMIGTAAIAGGVAIGYWKYKQPITNPLLRDLSDGEAALTPFVLINQDGISIIAPRAEMGQGVHTTLAALVAEELDVSLASVRIIHGPASSAYFNAAVMEDMVSIAQTDDGRLAETLRALTEVPAKFFGMQITGGSSSIADAYEKMRMAGAAAREVLLLAAAQQLQVPVTLLKTKKGRVVGVDGESLTYQDLAIAAANIDLPSEPGLKPQSEWKLLGKSQQRIDLVPKSTGTALFGIDVELAGMLFASIRVNPRLGAAMRGFDASDAKQMAGVIKIFEVDNGAAVIASNTWYAFKAVNAIKFDWADADYPLQTESHFRAVAESFNEELQDSRLRDDGDVESALQGKQVVEGEYRVPYLAHAALEPMNATVWLRDGMLDVWAGTQIPTQAVKEAIAITGLEENKISIHTTLMGGSFGRRLEMDFIIQAIKIAKNMEGSPIKLTWTREEDTTHDSYRPMAMARFKALVTDSGPNAIDLQLAAPSVSESQMGRLGITAPGPDVAIVQAAWDQPYTVPNYRVTGYRTPNAFPVSSWRSVGASQNGFFHESMMDEIAHAAGLDPLQLRLDLIQHEPSRKVLEAVAEMSNWGLMLPEGHGLGVAFCLSFGVPAAEVVEIAIIDEKVKIIKVYAAVDVGTALDPRNIEAQVSGGINFGLAAAMMGEITIEDGEVQQTNFHMFNSIRINQAPDIEVRVLENGSRIRGIGEPGTPPAAPALANAIFAATGKRIRELPLNKQIDFV